MSQKTYFNSLDAFRFISFFVVFLAHLGISEGSFLNFLAHSGEVGVSFFFVLSGFLITYILLLEKNNETRGVNLKNFFVRRVLRIWPLFYLMIGFAFVTPFILDVIKIQPSALGYAPNWLMSLFFLENYQVIIHREFANVSPLAVTWSLCVEEHFYVVWGLMFYFFELSTIKKTLLGFVFLSPLARIIFYNNQYAFLDLITNIDLFSFGAISAILFVEKSLVLNKIIATLKEHKMEFYIATLVLVFYLPSHLNGFFIVFEKTFFGCLFALIICLSVMIKNENSHSVFKVLGELTYSLYLTHTIVINLLIKLFEKYNFEYKMLVVSFLSLLLSLVVSKVIFHTIEKPFLSLKRFFR